jgi:hypothetical protein
MNSTRALLLPALVLIPILFVGCQPKPPPPVDSGPAPDPAVMEGKIDAMKMVASGTNKELVYKATQPGQLYVVDAVTGKYIYDAPLAAGEQFVFAPASSRATINKQTVDLIRGSNENDEYRMYFVPQ